jgi:UDP-N-acetylmuramyl pentapeptide phosphotransferase/UDP-N-acetylglucosamine-1-phosphate transferase
MIYIILFATFFLLINGYFKIADYFNIIDKPNSRSSHATITIRGGGVVFIFGALVYFILSGFQFPWFIVGLL